MNKIKVRIIGTREECERILSLLPGVKRVRKMDRLAEREKNPFNRIFGKAEAVFYVDLKKPKKATGIIPLDIVTGRFGK